MTERKEPDLLKKISYYLKKYGGEDSNFHHALKFHLTILRDSKTQDEIETKKEVCQYLFSKMFLDKMDLYPPQPFKCQIDEYADWPLSPFPSEFFASEKQEDAEKTKWFYQTLKEGNVLDCRVSDVYPFGYHLRVIHKYGVTRLLDDLHLMVSLHSSKNETKILEKQLLVCEHVRVAVFEITKVNNVVQSVSVTVDVEKFEGTSNFSRLLPRLGRISVKDIPSYAFDSADRKKFPSYTHYLISKPQFYNPHFYNHLIEGCGIDPKTVCSYFPEFNRKPCNEGQTGQALLKESKLGDAKSLANSALKYEKREKYDDGLNHLEKALKICPTDDSLMSKLYDLRSDMYTKQMKTGQNMKSLCDLEVAFKLAPEDDSVKQKLLHQIFKAANSCYRLKQYKKAVLGFEFILKHDKNHRLAARILDHIKTKHADQLLNFEEMSQIDLQEKKKELLTELKKIKTKDVDIKMDS